MPEGPVHAHPAIRLKLRRIALKRGPLVYCLEQVDNPDGFVQ